MSELLPLLFVLLVPVTVFFLSFVVQLARYKCLVVRSREVPPEDLSQPFLRRSRAMVDALLACGFRQVGATKATPLHTQIDENEGWILVHETEPIWARVGWVRGGPSAPGISLFTLHRHGFLVWTTGGLPGDPFSNYPFCDHLAIPTREAGTILAKHRQQCAKAAKAGWIADRGEILDLMNRVNAGYEGMVRSMAVAGKITIHQEGYWTCDPLFILEASLRMTGSLHNIFRYNQPSALTPSEKEELRRLAEATRAGTAPMARIPSTEDASGGGTAPFPVPGIDPVPTAPKKKSWHLTFWSMVAFAVVAGFTMSWSVVPALLLVLVVHEGGHLLAMKAFGYRDVKVLFVPFLGALATTDGQPERIAPWKRSIVALAGPLPGLVVALALPFVVGPTLFQSKFLVSVLATSVLLNLFNLLPLGGLDGGQYLSSSLFSRFPRAEFVFRVAGSLALAALAVRLEAKFVAYFSLMSLVTVGKQWAVAGARLELKRRVAVDGEPATEQVAQEWLDGILASPAWSRKSESVQTFVRLNSLRNMDWIPMPVWQSVVFVGGYLVLWSPFILGLLLWYSGDFSLPLPRHHPGHVFPGR